jgi:hypothetical protein
MSRSRWRLRQFLTDRLTEDLARATTAAHVEVIDDLVGVLARGQLPDRWELRIMLFGYGGHPDFDPAWNAELNLAEVRVPPGPSPGAA